MARQEKVEKKRAALKRGRMAAKVKRSGMLRDQLISELTKARYLKAVKALLSFWCVVGCSPTCVDDFDECCAMFVEAMWSEGDSINLPSQALAGLQWLWPSVKGHLPYAWKLTKAWAKAEPPNRATPFTPLMALGLAGLCVASNMVPVAALILVGFDGFLRSGELFAMKVGDISFRKGMAVIKLALTKSGKRRGLMEVIVITSKIAVELLARACQGRGAEEFVAPCSAFSLRKILRTLLAELQLDELLYSWYSLRRGGATAYFLQTGSMEKTLLRGRWTSSTVARLYIQDAVALANELLLPHGTVNILKGFANCIL